MNQAYIVDTSTYNRGRDVQQLYLVYLSYQIHKTFERLNLGTTDFCITSLFRTRKMQTYCAWYIAGNTLETSVFHWGAVSKFKNLMLIRDFLLSQIRNRRKTRPELGT